jgi:hypothetical protein
MTLAYRKTTPPSAARRGALSERVRDTLRRRRATAQEVSGENREMLRLEIVSMMAAIAGNQHGITWRGTVALADLRRYLPPEAPVTRERMNEAIFRFFNRVDDSDCARLEAIGYRLPSLSAGDLVTVETVTFLVATSAFERVTHNSNFAGFLLGRAPQS